MHGEGFFYQAFVYLAAAVIAVPIAKRLGLGSVLGYLAAGVAIGPFGLALVGREGQDVMHFAEFGVVMMLFLVGLELQPGLLWRLRLPILGMGGLQVLATAVVVTAGSMALGLDWRSASAVGLILSMSSTAIALQSLAERGMLKSQAGQASFSVLLFQDLSVIPILALLPLLALRSAGTSLGEGSPHDSTWVAGLPGWAHTLVVLGSVALIVLAGRFLFVPAFRFIAKARLRESFTAAALLLVIGIALLMTKVGLSPALGTFLAGVVLANSEYRHELEGDIEPFKGLLLGVFFIAVGAGVDFGLVVDRPLPIAGLVLAVMAAKLAVLAGLGRLFKLGLGQNLLFGFALSQVGEFAFVLFSFATQNRVLHESVARPLVAVVALSMAVTPLLLAMHTRFLLPRVGAKEKPERNADRVDDHGQVIIAGYGRVGSIVGRLLRANGVSATVLDIDSDHVELLRKLGFKVFYGDASRLDLLRAAGAEHARVLVVAVDDPEKILEIVHTAKTHFPQLTILARAVSRAHAYSLLDAGLTHVYRETLDTSLRVGADALAVLGFRAHQALRSARTFREHDERDLRELGRMRHDEKSYLARARERIADVERVLRSDLEQVELSRDEAWDTTSLREEFGRDPPVPKSDESSGA